MKHTIEISKAGVTALFELEQSGRTFTVCEAYVVGRPELSIGFDASSPGEILDKTSDARQVFDIATRIRVLDCTLDMEEMRAPDVETLRMALQRVKLRFWNQEDI